MSYTEAGITLLDALPYDLGLVLRVGNTHADKVAQCYLNGRLVAWQANPEATWTCRLPGVAANDILFLLAVDSADATTTFWSTAWPDPSAANRLEVLLPRTIAPYRPGDRWRIYRGNAGDPAADTLIHEARVYPGGLRACGFGSRFGVAGFGYDGADAVGFGMNFGYGEFGFDCEVLRWRSGPLPTGVYPIAVAAVDTAGNESPATTTTVALTTYARAARGLTVDNYDASADSLALTFTQSEDVA